MTLDDLDLILDVRSEAEYRRGHVYGAALIPTPLPPLSPGEICELAMRLAQMMVGVRADTAIGIYCKKGIRSGLALSMLRSMGYRNLHDLGGVEVSVLPLITE